MAASGDTPGGTPFPPNTSSQTPFLKRKTTKDEQPAKKQKLNDQPTVIDITEDPLGDMIVKVGKDEGARLVRVHSVFLKLGSDVFRAMLSTRFMEGCKTFTENDPLDLEDDDPDAFIKLCKVLHHQVRKEEDLKVADLPKLAVIADKYAAIIATKSTFAAMLGPLLGPHLQIGFQNTSRGWPIILSDIICISYLVGDAQLFWRATRQVIAKFDGDDISHGARPELLDLVSRPLFATLKTVRKLELGRLEGLIQFPLDRAFDMQDAEDDGPPNLCAGMKHTTACWLYSLWKLKEGFGALADTALRLDDCWEKLRTIAVRDLAPNRTCGHDEHDDWDELGAEVLERIEQSQWELHGLCLQCTREQVL